MLNITPEVLHRAEEGEALKIQHRTEYREVSRRFGLVSPSRLLTADHAVVESARDCCWMPTSPHDGQATGAASPPAW